jgi:hypothetical protein
MVYDLWSGLLCGLLCVLGWSTWSNRFLGSAGYVHLRGLFWPVSSTIGPMVSTIGPMVSTIGPTVSTIGPMVSTTAIRIYGSTGMWVYGSVCLLGPWD